MVARKIALVGIGKIAIDQHVPSIAGSADWELAATVSRHGNVEGVESYTDLDSMLVARPDIEAVSLCIPPVPRFDYAVRTLRAGRHVMLEKPPGATLAECHSLAEVARVAGASLFATWHSREADCVTPAKIWLKDKQVLRVNIVWKEDVRRWHPGQDWVFEPGGMGVFDPDINALSIVTDILPAPMHVVEAVLETPSNRQTPIAATLRFFYPEAEEVSAVFDWRHEGEQTWTIEIETNDGTLRLLDGGARMEIDGRTPGLSGERPLSGEYPRLYGRFSRLVDQAEIDMDLRPMIHVADALSRGERKTVEAFDW